MKNNRSSSLVPSLLLGFAMAAGAQQPAVPAEPAPPIPAVGDVAPDFAFRAVTKDGVAPAAAKLSDYRGQTVVLWFFIKARTRG
jgi:hypothetical protein